MNIFDKRPLSLILCLALWSFVFFAFSADAPLVRLLLILIPSVVFIISFIPSALRILKTSRLFLHTVGAVLSISVLLSFLYFDIWFYPAKRFDTDTVKVVGTVVDRDMRDPEAFTLKTSYINGEPFSAYKIRIYVDTERYPGVDVGAVLEFSCVLEDFAETSTGFAARDYYTARGIGAHANDITDMVHVRNAKIPLEYKITEFRMNIAKYIAESTDETSGGLLGALLLGEKEYLTPTMELNFKRLGITHILALSGMHLVMLSAAVNFLLRLMRLGKRASTAVSLIFAVLYTLITGMSVSILRAAIMLLISGILYLISETHDSITSLFISVAVILIFEPYAVYDMALWLSALATLGILVLAEYDRDTVNRRSFRRIIRNSLLSSLFAISATFTLSVLTFSETSLLAAPATLIYSFLTEIFLYAGIVHILVCSFLPTGGMITILGGTIDKSMSALSDIDILNVSVNFPVIRTLSLIFAAFVLVFILFKIKHKRTAISMIAFFLIGIYTLSAFMTSEIKTNESITYNLGATEQIVITGGGDAMLVDIGSHCQSSAYETAARLSKMHITSLDTYVFMNYSGGLKMCINTLIGDVKIEKIYLPVPKNEEEDEIFSSVREHAERFGSEISLFNNEEVITLSQTKIIPCNTEIRNEECEIILAVFHGDDLYTYVSSKALEGKTKLAALDLMCNSDTVMIGRRGTVDEFVFNIRIDDLERLILCHKKIKLFPELMEFYDGQTDIYDLPDAVELIH